MTDATVIAALIGAGAGALVVVLLAVAWRLVRGRGGLGSDAEQSAYQALHRASRAAPYLRDGLLGPDVERSARELHALLGGAGLALVADGRVAAAGLDASREAAAVRVAARVVEQGTRQILTPSHGDLPSLTVGAVGEPIRVEGRVAGVLVSFADALSPAFVRATGEVATWCGAQLTIGEIDRARAQLAETQLRALRAQISPHFIYNSLTAIASFITTDPVRARELVLEFADFTRYSFRRQGEFTTLAEELRSIHSYLELERARFGERLRVVLQVAPETLATVIPFLSVQPLVENAVRHGIEPSPTGGTVTIRARAAGTRTEVTVEDDGVGMDPGEAKRMLRPGARTDAEGSPAHVGLRNVDTRLRRLYGPSAALVVETGLGAGTFVSLRVPMSQPQNSLGEATSPLLERGRL